MAGRMGGDKLTIKSLHVISIDQEKNEMLLSGMVPGKFGDLVRITKISEGSLEELQHGAVAHVVEGGTAKIAGSGAAAAPAQGGTNA